MNEYIPMDEVAKVCMFPTAKIESWIRSGELPARKNSNTYEIQCSEVIRFLQKKRYMLPEEYVKKATYRVLIVDDEPIIRKLLRENLLDAFSGIIIDESSDVLDAGWRAHTATPDLILLDLNLPGMDGFQLCRLIRQRGEFLRTKIIAVSGQTDLETRDKIIECGANAFVSKPFQTKDILEPIYQLLPVFREFSVAA
jgi:CheY-like chemotaxis protein